MALVFLRFLIKIGFSWKESVACIKTIRSLVSGSHAHGFDFGRFQSSHFKAAFIRSLATPLPRNLGSTNMDSISPTFLASTILMQ